MTKSIEEVGEVAAMIYDLQWMARYTSGPIPATMARAAALLTRLQREKEELRDVCDKLKLEAQGHAMEARSANSTINEIYQIVTGATGEPGNWNGAEPVRKRIAELEAAERDLAAVREALQELVALKDLEDTGTELSLTEYKRLAWEAARAALQPDTKEKE